MSGEKGTVNFSKPHLPKKKTGHFVGQLGNSAFIPNSTLAQKKMSEFGTDCVIYRNGYPDFSPFTQIHDEMLGDVDGQVEIGHMTENRHNPSYDYGRRTSGHAETEELGNFAQADNELAKKINAERGTQLTGRDIEKMRQRDKLTWHEVEDGKTLQLIPTEIHNACPHSGGVSAMRDVHRVADEAEDVDGMDDDLHDKNVMEYIYNEETGALEVNRSNKRGLEGNDPSVGTEKQTGQADLSKEDIQQIWEDDFGAINADVFDYDDPDYINEGILKTNWGNAAAGDKEQIVLPEGTRIVQYSHPGQSGIHFAPEGTKYEDLQLPDSQDKRIANVYEVQEGGLPVETSEIAVQPWNQGRTAEKGTGTKQYITADNADKLVANGRLDPVGTPEQADTQAVPEAEQEADVLGQNGDGEDFVPDAADEKAPVSDESLLTQNKEQGKDNVPEDKSAEDMNQETDDILGQNNKNTPKGEDASENEKASGSEKVPRDEETSKGGQDDIKQGDEAEDDEILNQNKSDKAEGNNIGDNPQGDETDNTQRDRKAPGHEATQKGADEGKDRDIGDSSQDDKVLDQNIETSPGNNAPSSEGPSNDGPSDDGMSMG